MNAMSYMRFILLRGYCYRGNPKIQVGNDCKFTRLSVKMTDLGE